MKGWCRKSRDEAGGEDARHFVKMENGVLS